MMDDVGRAPNLMVGFLSSRNCGLLHGCVWGEEKQSGFASSSGKRLNRMHWIRFLLALSKLEQESGSQF